ncbi:TonB-dependent hemoglobin/transferrin/lactoferrin family receptor [Stenotrophomonas sp. PS02297]|uniref:TonB-dependent hemoglobin/transferrin/lactoferrin family receptor n=1 Tax=Stenotrophomonas sp. PS02297 TaxID=2991423 RepID=UPI00249C3A4C|nr:TonB-dependent hemoglobin/transferrin/lactoferrin family receptor [Stenotrophomonas sp. PS02297]
MKPAPSLLTLAILSGLSPLAHADAAPDARTLDTVKVEAARENNARSATQNVRVVTRAELDDEMAESMEDLVRYIPGVSIADMGRFGDNGFNIRGMEGDRVSMTIDGLGMAEGLETARSYEFFRAGRGGVDIDTLKQVEVIKGADAIAAGSGSLGGGVVFTTKDPSDYLKPSGNDSFGSVKLGYTGYNDEKLGSFTAANRTGIVESMLVYTKRKAHESEGWYDSTAVATGSARRLPDPIDHDSDNVLAKVDFVLSPEHRLGVVYERNRVDNLVDNLSRVSAPGYLQRWGEDSNSRDRYGLRYVWNAGNAAFDTAQLQVDRQKTDSRGITRVVSGSGSSANPTVTPNTTACTLAATCQRAEDRHTAQVLDRVALDMDKRAGAHALIYGASWQNREIDYGAIDYRWNNAGVLDTATVDPGQVPRTDAASWNVYLRDRIDLLDERLQLNLGARYDRHDYTPHPDATFVDRTGTVRPVRFASPTWQAGLSYLAAAGHTLWFQAGRGFRAPTTGEMYAPTSTTDITEVATGKLVTVPTSAANPDLASEKSLNLELGWRWESVRSRLGVSVFRDRYDDFIESVRVLRDPGIEYRTCTGTRCSTALGYSFSSQANVGEVTVKGVEAEGLWQLGDAWLLRAVYSHNEGELRGGKPLDSINPDRGVLGLSWQGMDERLRLTGALTHALAKKRKDVAVASDVFGQVAEPFLSDAYTVFDLFGSLRVNAHLKISAGVYNLFDERYYQWARIRNVTRGDFYLYGYATEEGIGRYSEPGRNYRVNLTWTF